MTGGAASAPGGLPRYLDLPVRAFLGELAAAKPAPAAGSAVALTLAMAASLAEMSARLSASQLGADAAADLAEIARQAGSRAGELIEADAAAFAGVIRGRRAAKSGDPGARAAVADALAAAADVPMQIIEAAAELAPLAARLAADGNPNLRGDAVTAALLTQAAARAAAVLVSINLTDAWPGSPAGIQPKTARAAVLLARISEALATLDAPG